VNPRNIWNHRIKSSRPGCYIAQVHITQKSSASSLWIWASIVTSLVSARAAFTDFVNSGVSGGRWTLDSLATLIYAVVNSQMYYCNTVLAGAPRTVTDNLQRGVERCCACYHRHLEVWSRPWSGTARPTALARRSRPGSLQASSDSSPVSERPRTTVSVGALHPGLQCRHAAASAFRQPSPTCRIPSFQLNTQPSGILSCWSDGLELTPRFHPGSNE